MYKGSGLFNSSAAVWETCHRLHHVGRYNRAGSASLFHARLLMNIVQIVNILLPVHEEMAGLFGFGLKLMTDVSALTSTEQLMSVDPKIRSVTFNNGIGLHILLLERLSFDNYVIKR